MGQVNETSEWNTRSHMWYNISYDNRNGNVKIWGARIDRSI